MKTLSNREILKQTRKQALDRKTRTIYVPVSDNIYYNGLSFRVRVKKDGVKISKNFSSKSIAISFRNILINL